MAKPETNRDYKAATITEVARCDQCRFWILGEQLGEQKETNPDEREGACHRNAPRPTMGEFEYRVLQALVLIAPDQQDLAEHWEEAYLAGVTWPTTMGEDFCGEFSKKETLDGQI